MAKEKFNFEAELTRAVVVGAMRNAVELLNDPDADEFSAARAEYQLRMAIDRMHSHYPRGAV